MPVTDVRKDTETLTMTITAEFDASVERVWGVWADPRKLERWWGPPTYPATFTEHDLAPGGRSAYFMTGPEGDKHHGWFRFTSVDAPKGLELEEGFADEHGTPTADMPTTAMQLRLEERPGGGTVMSLTSTFASLDAMEQLTAMGMEEGMKEAMGQIDAILAEG